MTPATRWQIERAYRLEGYRCQVGVRSRYPGDDLVHIYIGRGQEGTLIPRWKAVGFTSEYHVGADDKVFRIKAAAP